MENLLIAIEKLKKTEIGKIVNKRIKNFESLGKKSNEEIFKELCFCIMTANFQAEKSIRIQESIDNGLLTFSEKKLASRLKKEGHRFPNARANYIFEARKHKDELKKKMNELNEKELREWLAKNIKGLGYKESSHFLRNVGYKNLAILDFHIIDILVEKRQIKRPKTVNKKKYLEIEKILEGMAKKEKMNLAELDLYLWYSDTGKILK